MKFNRKIFTSKSTEMVGLTLASEDLGSLVKLQTLHTHLQLTTCSHWDWKVHGSKISMNVWHWIITIPGRVKNIINEWFLVVKHKWWAFIRIVTMSPECIHASTLMFASVISPSPPNSTAYTVVSSVTPRPSTISTGLGMTLHSQCTYS